MRKDSSHGARGGWTRSPAAELKPGAAVHGSIDWGRRFDHMQQHSGQHLLSAAFDRLFGVRTVSFHLGVESCTIDLAREAKANELNAAEDDANRIVWEDRPVSIRFVAPEEVSRLQLRKEPAREGPLRIVDIGGYDLSACGGTHVSRSGAVGLVAIAGAERFKGGQRVEFVCGRRALARMRSLRDSVAASVRLLSVLPGEVPPTIERLQNDAKDARRAMASLQASLGRYQAMEMAASAEDLPCGEAVLRSVDADASVLKTVASAITAAGRRVAVLVSEHAPVLVVVAASAESGVRANELLAALIRRFGGRGGGKPDLAQGGGLEAAPAAILAASRDLLLKPE